MSVFMIVPQYFNNSSHPVMSNSLVTPWILCPWDYQGKNTRVSCYFLLQGIFPNQGVNPCLHVFCTEGGFFTTEPLGNWFFFFLLKILSVRYSIVGYKYTVYSRSSNFSCLIEILCLFISKLPFLTPSSLQNHHFGLWFCYYYYFKYLIRVE